VRAELRATLVAAALFVCLAASPPARAESGDESAPRALLDLARLSAGAGDWPTASACLVEALVGAPLDSDILYLSALSLAKLGAPLADPLAKLDAALSSGRFSYYSKRDAALLKAELLVRERRWAAALGALGAPSVSASSDPSYAMIRAKALAFSGQSAAFTAEIGGDLRRFPDDSSFARLFLSRLRDKPVSSADRAIGDLILDRLPRYALVDPELPVLALPLMPEASSRRDAVLAYRAGGGKSAAATLRALEYGLIDEGEAASELLAGAYRPSLVDLQSLNALAGSAAGREAVHVALAAWSGDLALDSEGDGVSEGSISLDRGLTTRFALDSDQDGERDFRADFTEGLPSHVSLIRGKVEISVEYSSYPAVAAIRFDDQGESRIYSFGPDGLSYAPLAMRGFSGTGKGELLLPFLNPVVDPSERTCASSALSVERKGGDESELVILDKGLPVSASSFRDGKAYSQGFYEKGRRSHELVDLDGDGRFEMERSFGTGPEGAWMPTWARLDADGDGLYEYREQLIPPHLKEWDYDGNGSVDARQLEKEDCSIVKDFSSRLDGRLDESLVVKSGKLVSLVRDGIALQLQRDANPSLTWIGRKPFDLGSNLPPGEGVFSYMDLRYTLTRVGSLAFAELVP
jgi:hypothetical protein